MKGSNFNVLVMAFTPQPTKAEVWQQSHTSTQFHAFSGDPLEQNLQPTFKLPLHTILLKSHLIGDKTIWKQLLATVQSVIVLLSDRILRQAVRMNQVTQLLYLLIKQRFNYVKKS